MAQRGARASLRRGVGFASVVDPVEVGAVRGRRGGEVAGAVDAGGVARFDSTTAGVRDSGVVGVPFGVPAPGLTWAHALTLSAMANTTNFFIGKGLSFSWIARYGGPRIMMAPVQRSGRPCGGLEGLEIGGCSTHGRFPQGKSAPSVSGSQKSWAKSWTWSSFTRIPSASRRCCMAWSPPK